MDQGNIKALTGGAAAFVLLFCLIYLPGCKEKTVQPQPPPPKVSVVEPLKQNVTYYLELTGNTQAVNSVQLVARIPGYLDKVLFKDGQMVKKGQLLFIIQQDTYQAGLRQAEGQVQTQKAQLGYAKSQFERYTSLLPDRAASQSDVENWRYQRDSAEAGLKTAEANAELARLNLGYTRVTAPFDGRIDRRLQDPGNLVGSSSSNAVLARMDQINPIYIYFTVSDTDLARLMKSAKGIPGLASRWPAFAGLTNEEGYPHKGRIDFTATSLSSNTGTLLMRGVFPNPAGTILPGLYARVRVPLETRPAMLVPATAVGSDQEGTYVLAVGPQDVVQRISVRTGPIEGGMRVVEEGLAGNERIVSKALLKARQGAKVTPEREEKAAKGDK